MRDSRGLRYSSTHSRTSGTRNGEEETLFVSDSSQLNQDSNSGERAYKASALPTIPRDPPADR